MPAPNDVHDVWARATVSENGCWEISGAPIRGGYVRIGFGGRKPLAHRWAWEQTNGAIPAGLFVCHRCDNPRCIRPSHLFLGTRLDNIKDMVAKGRGANRYTHGLRPTHCPAGHSYADSGKVTKRGKLACLKCDAARSRRYYAANAERIKAEKRARYALHGDGGEAA